MEVHSRLDPGPAPKRRRGETGNIWKTLIVVTLPLLILAGVAAVALLFVPVVKKVQEQQVEKAANEKLIAAEKEKIQKQQKEVELLKTNPEYVERQARDVLGRGKPGEVIFRFDSYQPEATPAPPTAAATPPGISSARP